MSLVLQSTGGGSVTINEPTTASNFTLSLPAETATVLTTNTDLSAIVKTSLNASGSAPIYAARAWVNFDGTGTPAIRSSGNVSSITDNGTADYTVNFTSAMPDTNYTVAGMGRQGDGAVSSTMRVVCICAVGNLADAMTTTSVRVSTQNANGSADEIQVVCVNIFR
jgi:hypothetical protein